jgi:hypothetical protein
LVLKYHFCVTFILCAFIIKAQSNYEFYKSVDTINTILYKNPKIFYVENGNIIKNIKKVQANQYGKIRIIDTIYTEIDSSEIKTPPHKEVFLDLFKYETLVIYGSQIHYKDKGNNTYRTIYGFNNKDILIFKKQLESIKTYCQKNKAIDYIKSYYFDFRTGYDFGGKFVTITDNYKVKLNESLFTLTFDTFENNSKSTSVTVSFNLKDIIAIEPNGGDTAEIIGSETLIIPLNGKLLFKTAKEEYNLNIYYEVDEDVTQTEIYNAFNRLWSLFIH